MPTYLYRNPDDESEIVEVQQSMNDEHVFFGDDGKQWKRVFTKPQASIDTHIDPFSKKQFVEKTAKGGTIGDLWDRSEELSHKRAEKIGGADPIRTKAEKNFYNPKKKI